MMRDAKRILLALTTVILTGCLTGCIEEGADTHPGETIYNRSCFSCHASGAGGAPLTGDAEAWAPRIARGKAALLQSVRDGIPPGMPAMGLCPTCSDEDLQASIDFMIEASQ